MSNLQCVFHNVTERDMDLLFMEAFVCDPGFASLFIEKLSIRRPMKWKEFKAMPEDLQRDYLRYIDDVFNPSAATLGVMFGVSSASVLTARKALGVINPHGGRANNGWNPAAWEEWVTQQQEEASTPESFPSIEDVPQKSREEEPFSVSGGEFTLIATPAELAQLLTVIGGGRAA